MSEIMVHIRNAVNVKASGKIINKTRKNDALYTRREFRITEMEVTRLTSIST